MTYSIRRGDELYGPFKRGSILQLFRARLVKQDDVLIKRERARSKPVNTTMGEEFAAWFESVDNYEPVASDNSFYAAVTMLEQGGEIDATTSSSSDRADTESDQFFDGVWHTRLTYAPEDYGSFIRRALAAAVDGFVLGALFAGYYAMRSASTLFWLEALCLFLLYMTLLKRGFNGMPGYRLLKIRLISVDGKPPTWTQVFIRQVSSIFSAAVMGLGFLWILLHRDRQAWHDRIARTHVIREGAQPGQRAPAHDRAFLRIGLFFIQLLVILSALSLSFQFLETQKQVVETLLIDYLISIDQAVEKVESKPGNRSDREYPWSFHPLYVQLADEFHRTEPIRDFRDRCHEMQRELGEFQSLDRRVAGSMRINFAGELTIESTYQTEFERAKVAVTVGAIKSSRYGGDYRISHFAYGSVPGENVEKE